MPDSKRSNSSSQKLNASTLEQLACPVCFAALRLIANEKIACTGCGRMYPLIDGIPVLIAERALNGL